MLKDPSKACRVMAISCLGRRVRMGLNEMGLFGNRLYQQHGFVHNFHRENIGKIMINNQILGDFVPT